MHFSESTFCDNSIRPDSIAAGAPEVTAEMVAAGMAVLMADPWYGDVCGEGYAEDVVRRVVEGALAASPRKTPQAPI
jgi:hypothetical protein